MYISIGSRMNKVIVYVYNRINTIQVSTKMNLKSIILRKESSHQKCVPYDYENQNQN